MQLPRGLRNNNPGNLEDGPFTRSLPGYVGTDGRHAIFDTIDSGYSAMDRLLSAPRYRNARGIGDIVSQWAPASDGNDVGAYTGYVAKRLGVDPNDPAVLSDPTKRSALLQAMAEYENGPDAMRAFAGGNTMPPMTRGALSAYAAGDDEEPAAPQGILGQVLQGGLGAPFGLEGRSLGNSAMLAGLALQGKDPASLMWAMDRPKLPKIAAEKMPSFRPVIDKDGNVIGSFNNHTGEYASASGPGGAPLPTMAEREADKKFAPTVAEWETSGGLAGVNKDLTNLSTSYKTLNANKDKLFGVTGPVTGLLGDTLNSFINPEALKTRDSALSALQSGLTKVLGAQFARQEGEQYLQRAFDQRLGERENMRRVGLVMQQLKAMAEAKEAAVKYFKEKGTLRGYTGKFPSAADLPSFDDTTETPTPTKKSVIPDDWSVTVK